jgi:beta-fructofuranosidase
MNRRKFLFSSLVSSAMCALGTRAAQALDETGQQAALREKLMRDPLRPQFHLLPPANWMNDPCAPRFFRGQYHMLGACSRTSFLF